MSIMSSTSSFSLPSIGPQDVGGKTEAALPILEEEVIKPRALEPWEKRVDAMVSSTMFGAGKPLSVHRLRREVESLDPSYYKTASYYEKWLVCTIRLCLQNAFFTNQELQATFRRVLPEAAIPPAEAEGGTGPTTAYVDVIPQTLKVGDHVRVRPASNGQGEKEALATVSLPNTHLHLRAPGYIHGKVGTVELIVAAFGNPTLLSLGLQGPKQPLYRVRFSQRQVWGEQYQGPETDTIDVELYENWLEKVDDHHYHEKEEEEGGDKKRAKKEDKEGEEHHHEHLHDGGEPHVHTKREEIEKLACEKEAPLTSNDILTQALQELLIEKKMITAATIQSAIDSMDSAKEQLLGGLAVVEAWRNDEFKQFLLTHPSEACRKLGLDPGYAQIYVVENLPDVHNIIVCTLCSCYPRSLLGIPPDWYKSYKYRSRVVVEPRQVLKELGVDIPDHVKVQVHDSTADLRYLVLPLPPKGCDPKDEKKWSKQDLRAMLTRDCLIGAALPKLPSTTPTKA